MSACSEQQNNIQVFYTKNATNHPGGEAGSRNWYHYWKAAYGLGSCFVYDDWVGIAMVSGMVYWSYADAPDKITRYMQNGSAGEVKWEVDPVYFGPWTGIDAFYNCCHHETHHVSQISSADGIVGTAAGTCWRYGWSWNQVSHNHWTVGNDGQPGYLNVNDDSDGYTDNQRTDGPGEMGAAGSDDVPLGGQYSRDWPDSWGVPPGGAGGPWAQGNPVEHAAWGQMGIDEDQYWQWDWGNKGKQHATNKVYDD
jgi:hypothetical protein